VHSGIPDQDPVVYVFLDSLMSSGNLGLLAESSVFKRLLKEEVWHQSTHRSHDLR
jgi:hypothetical protein